MKVVHITERRSAVMAIECPRAVSNAHRRENRLSARREIFPSGPAAELI
jgi:hypothetical protein